MKRVASAPGKLVVAGEYSVLDGHAAWVTAVDRRATCAIHIDDARLDDQNAQVLLRCAGKEDAVVRLKATLPPSIGGGDAAFFDLAAHVLQVLFTAQLLPTDSTLDLDSAAMSTIAGANGSTIKLGVGSSAAVSAAMVCAIAPQLEADERHRLADAAHAAFSAGQGSGVDVAASCVGGHLTFHRTAKGATAVPFKFDRPDVALLPVFVGHAQNTREFVTQVNGLKVSDAPAYAHCIAALSTTSKALMNEARLPNAPLFDAVEACRMAMAELGRAAAIDIVSAPHRLAAQVAHSFGGAAKPSGAGGGDVALVFVPSSAAPRVREALALEGLTPLALGTGAEGARLETDLSGVVEQHRLAE